MPGVKRKIKKGYEPWVGAEERAGMGRLRDMGIRPLTLERYRRAVAAFLQFALMTFGLLAGTMDTLDLQASEYLEYLWECGEGRAMGSDCLAGIPHFLVRRRCLPSAWTLLGIWNTMEMPRRTPPLPYNVLLALVGRACTYSQWGLAAALMIAWRAFLRTGEMLSARFCHISCSGTHIVLALPLTKIGRRRGQQEVVTIDCAICAYLLRLAAKTASSSELLVSFGPYGFRKWWSEGLAILGMSSEVFKPYSIRRGAASWHLQTVGSLELTIFKGRWCSAATARTYVQEGLARLAQSQLSAHSNRVIGIFVRALERCLRAGI